MVCPVHISPFISFVKSARVIAAAFKIQSMCAVCKTPAAGLVKAIPLNMIISLWFAQKGKSFAQFGIVSSAKMKENYYSNGRKPEVFNINVAQNRGGFMKGFVGILLIGAICSFACSAGTYYFKHDPAYLTDQSDPNDWSNPLNWFDGYGSPVNLVPVITDYVNNFYEPDFTCIVKNNVAVKSMLGFTTGYMAVKNNATFQVDRQWHYPETIDCNIDGVISPALGTVDIDAGSTITVGKVGYYQQENLTVAHVGNGTMNIKGTLTALNSTSNTMTIAYGQPDINNIPVPSTGIVNVSGNGKINGFCGIYQCVCGGEETATLNVLDNNSTVTCTNLYNSSGPCTINVHNGLITCTNLMNPWGSTDLNDEQHAAGTINISGNGRIIFTNGPTLPDFDQNGGFSINLLGNYVMCAVAGTGLGPRYSGTLNIMDNNSIFDCNSAMIGEGGPATINLNAGTFNCNTLYLTYPQGWKGNYGSCQINVYGGTFTVRRNWQPGYNSARNGGNNQSHVDIRNHGKLVLPYSQYSAILNDISLGIIQAYGGAGRVMVATNPTANTVTLTGCPSAGPVRGDVNNDCVVDFLDVQILAQTWLNASGNADFNTDGRVNAKDFAIIASNWLYNK
jgi:hypothetical protein